MPETPDNSPSAQESPLQDYKQLIEVAKEEEEQLLTTVREKARLLFRKLDSNSDNIRFILLLNAETRYEPDDIGLMRQLVDNQHDEALGFKWRGYLEEKYVPRAVKLVADFAERIADKTMAEMAVDSAKITDKEILEFIEIQIRIANAEIGILQSMLESTTIQNEIKDMKKTVSLYQRLVDKANASILIGRRLALKKDVETKITRSA